MKVFQIVFSALFFLFSLPAMAADYWSPDQGGLRQCELAVKGSGVDFYTPKLKNPVEKGDIVDTFSAATPGCIVMYVTREDGTRGMATVAVSKGGIKKLSSGRTVWTECHNLVTNYLTVIFGSQQSELSRPGLPISQDITLIPQVCDTRCQSVKVCEKEGGTLQSGPNGDWVCRMPGGKLTLLQEPLKVYGVVEPAQFMGWQQPAALNVPGAPTPQVNVARPQNPVVHAQQCRCVTTGQVRPVGHSDCEARAAAAVTPPQTKPFGQNVGNVTPDARGGCSVLTPQGQYLPAPGMVPRGGACVRG